MKVEVAIADTEQCKKDLTIEVAAEEVKQQFDKTVETYARHAKVPGFRPGHVPRGVIKQRFSKDIKDEVLGQLLPHALEHAIVDHKLHVVGEPKIDDLSFTEGEPLRFKASVEVVPEFELKDYKNLKAVKRVARVTDEDVEGTLGDLRESFAQLVPVEDRPAADGDFVSVNLVGKYVAPSEAPAEQEDLKADDVVIELGAEGVQPEFDEGLRGVRAGDVREFRVAYPEDFTSKGLAGKTLDFTANVVAVRRKELPELDDDLAKELGEHQTIGELREKVREDLRRHAEHQAETRLRDELFERILDSYDFPLPDSLVEKQVDDRMREIIFNLARSGLSPETAGQINWKERRGAERLRAVRDVRGALVVGRIAEEEGVEVAEGEIDAEVARLAASMREPVEAVRARVTKGGGLTSIENRLRYQKALDVIVKSADITTEEFTDNQTADQATHDAQPPAESQPAEQA